MSIRSVNGKSVYVLEPSNPAAAVTSAGRSWSTLYSDLRWKVWEEVQKAELERMKISFAVAEDRQALIDNKRKFIQQQILQLQEAQSRGEKQQKDFATDQALRAAEGLRENAKAMSGGGRAGTGFEQIVTRPKKGFGGMESATQNVEVKTIKKPLAPEESGLSEKALADLEKSSAYYRSVLEKFNKGEASAAELSEAEGAVNAAKSAASEESIDAQISRLEKELEALEVSRPTLDTSGLGMEAKRRAFAGSVGVIGQGGGAFGLAPRSRRTAPIVFEDVATERINQALSARAEALQGLPSVDELSRRKAELESKILGIDESIISDFDKLAELETARSQLSDVNKALAGISSVSGPGLINRLSTASQTFVPEGGAFVPREAGDLLLRDRRELDFNRAGEFDRERIRREEEEKLKPSRERLRIQEEEIPPRFQTPPQRPGLPPGSTNRPPSFEELDAMSMSMAPRSPSPSSPITPSSLDLQFLGAAPGQSLEITPATPLIPRSVAPPPSVPSTAVELGTMAVPAPTPIAPPPPRAAAPPPPSPVTPVQSPAADLSIVPPESVMKKLSLGTEDITVPYNVPGFLWNEKEGILFGKDGQPFLSTKSEIGSEPQQTPEMMRARLKELQKAGEKIYLEPAKFGPEKDKIKELPPIEEAKVPSTKQRKDLYQVNIIKEGIKLASQPAKLARIAKTEAPADKRPSHLVIVDQLFAGNEGKVDRFKATYDEISRVFSSEPAKRKEAHQYLVAKNILEDNIKQPLS
jgi:hypothetical protein